MSRESMLQEYAVEPRAGAGELADSLALAGEQAEEGANWARVLRQMAGQLRSSARAAGARSAGQWLAETFAGNIAPRIPIRNAETLHTHHPGLGREQLADALVRTAARGTAAVGVAGGAASAASLTAPPLLLTAPALLTAEAVTVAAIEVKLIAELHEAYGAAAPGGALRRTSSYVTAWTMRRGLESLDAAEPMGLVLSAAAKAALRDRLMRLAGRHLSTLGPYLSGALAGGMLNRTGTRALAKSIRGDLRT